MNTILYRIRRLLSVRPERLAYCIEKCAERSHRSKAVIFADMLLCYLLYGAVYTDYLLFGFDALPLRQKRNYLTRTRFRRLTLQLNPPSARKFVNSKLAFYSCYPDPMRRTILPANAPDEVLRRFLQKNLRFVLKPDIGTGGNGVCIVSCSDYPSEQALFGFIRSKADHLLEEIIPQHPQMAYFNKDSLNTLRIVYLNNGEMPVLLYCSLRVGRKGSAVDNLCSGGMICAVNTKACRVISDAFDNNGNQYHIHPDCGTTVFQGSPVPCVAEALSLCRTLAEQLYCQHDLGLIGFDVAIAPTGPVLVETNAFPTHYGWQRPGFVDVNTPTALMPRIREIRNQ